MRQDVVPWATIAALLLALVPACPGAGGDRGAPTTSGVATVPGAASWSLPVPAGIPALPVLQLHPGNEIELRQYAVCPTVTSMIDGETWVKVLRDDGYVAQTGGWIDNGPIAVRFRRGDVYGDLFASATFQRGCRDYIVRLHRFTPEATPWTWANPFFAVHGPGLCRPIFDESPDFPFDDEAYGDGCRRQP